MEYPEKCLLVALIILILIIIILLLVRYNANCAKVHRASGNVREKYNEMMQINAKIQTMIDSLTSAEKKTILPADIDSFKQIVKLNPTCGFDDIDLCDRKELRRILSRFNPCRPEMQKTARAYEQYGKNIQKSQDKEGLVPNQNVISLGKTITHYGLSIHEFLSSVSCLDAALD